MTTVVYEQPREKLARKGATALSNTELLQVIIGSGNGQVSVARIAKKVAKILNKSGSSVHPQELLAIQGIGRVRAGQILAIFELAARFPAQPSGPIFDSASSYVSLYDDLRTASAPTLLYVTFDGAKRAITKRQTVLNATISVSKQVQKVFADCLVDSAGTIFIALGYSQQELEPGLLELSLVRDIYKTSQLLSIPINQFVLVSKEHHNILKESVL